MRRLWMALLLAAGAGVLLALAFPPAGLERALAVAAVALYAISVEHRRARSAALVTFVGQLVFMLLHVKWAGEFLGWLPWVALAVWQASYYLLLGPAIVAVRRLRGWPVWAAAAWVAIEAFQARWPFGGFPWTRLGFSQDAGPYTPFAAYGGVPLMSFAVALTGFLIAAAWFRWRAGEAADREWLRRLGYAAAVPVIGLAGWLGVPSGEGEGAPEAVVAVIQGNVPRAGLDFNAQRRAVLDNHVKQTLELAAAVGRGDKPAPDIVLWPENSSDIDPYRNADAASEIQQAADAINAPILVGAVVDGPGENVRNMGILWLPQTGPDQTYVKRHPVPFAEYMPARAFFRTFTSLVDLLRTDFVAGDRVGTIDVPGHEKLVLGDVICFEVAYDGLVADVVDGGATIITVQTNNATFGYTNEAPQQLAMARIRAVEHGRSVLSASTSGISAIITPDGAIVQRTGIFEPGILVASVPLRTASTLASELRWWPELVISVGGVLAVGWSVVGYRRKQHPRAKVATGASGGSTSGALD
ncbi:apolipoprotein N-acyltransferase [Cumulibacter manganitolerans]|uniref:apolipoprotein N-acyltransferase n=1 Tax=Cumulibacter manganitolerans TaxID=1884992 RepID=UPI001294FA39|nr:apolipoprotein N-acyltransferase [Cumulibacter manganitolerans]